MHGSISKLVGIGGPSLAEASSSSQLNRIIPSEAASVLGPLFAEKNGFYAFESTLHVRGTADSATEISLVRWNRPDLWVDSYKGMARGAVFFAEDVFGNQFCLYGGQICSFDPETGEFEQIAKNVEEWALKVLEDPPLLTGSEIGRAWQECNGPLQQGTRLVGRTPFVLGGEYAVENLYAANDVEGMRYRAEIAIQIRDLPDGSKIRLRVVE
jgi:hypothetical protein